MARIELEGARPMEEIEGFHRIFDSLNAKNPYTTDKLTDDEFNFISGINYAITKMAETASKGLEDFEELEDNYKPLAEMKLHYANKALAFFAETSNMELESMITRFIEEHEEESKDCGFQTFSP